MSQWVYCSQSYSSNLGQVTLGKNDAYFFFNPGFNGTESICQVVIPGTFTAKLLSIKVVSITGTLTLKDRKNGADGGQSLSITTTGVKEAAGTTALAANDLYCGEIIMSSGHSDAAVVVAPRHVLDDEGAGISFYPSSCWATRSAPYSSLNTGAVTYVSVLGWGYAATGNTRPTDDPFSEACTLSKMDIHVASNSEGVDRTFNSYLNASGTGNQAVSVTASTTGHFQDASNSDSLSAGATACIRAPIISSALTIHQVSMYATSATVRRTGCHSYSPNSWYPSLGGTNFASLSCMYATGSTEANCNNTIGVADTFKKLYVHILTNTLSVGSTVYLRVNGAAPGGGPSITVPSSTTGYFNDASGSYTTSTSDLVCYAWNAPAGSGAATSYYASIQQGVGTTTTIKTIEGLAYASVKTIEGLARASVKTIEGLA